MIHQTSGLLRMMPEMSYTRSLRDYSYVDPLMDPGSEGVRESSLSPIVTDGKNKKTPMMPDYTHRI